MDDVLGYAGRRAVVTGAASGMGAATARLLTEMGARVTALDINPTQDAVDQAIAVDLRDEAAIDKALGAVDGPVDAVFYCAGLPGAPFSDLDVMLVNFVATKYLVESLVPRMPAGSAVAAIASTAGMGWQERFEELRELITSEGFGAGRDWCEANPEDVAPAYATSKQALMAWTTWRSFGLIGQGIRINALCPGPTETPMMPAFEEQMGGGHVMDLLTAPINRRSTPEEQAWALVMLNSPRLTYVNGHTFFADGGFVGGVQAGNIPAKMMRNRRPRPRPAAEAMK